MPFATGVLGGRHDLGSRAQLLHALCFDPIELKESRLGYESRWSAQCAECAALWIASKAGKVMRIDLEIENRGDRPGQPPDEHAESLDGAVRTMCHVHRGAGLGPGSFVLLGRDNGFLDVIADPPRGDAGQPTVARFHLHAWYEDGGGALRRVSEGYARPDAAAHHLSYTAGITAIAVIPRPNEPDVLRLLVATRQPRLYVIEARAGQVRVQAAIALPGWIEWIICGDDTGRFSAPTAVNRVTCVSRSGDLVRFTIGELLEGKPGRRSQLSLLPTAAMPLGDHLVLGTTTGLFLIRDGLRGDARDAAIALPVTRSPVLCLDRAVLRAGAGDASTRDYVTMGLEDGRLRVLETALLDRLAAGEQQPMPHLHGFTIELDSAVMAVETIRPDRAPIDAAYVMAVLRDHSVRLFHVTSQDTQRDRFRQLWRAHVASRGAPIDERGLDATTAFEVELRAARAPAPAGCSDPAWSFALIDVVLSRLHALANQSGEPRLAAEVVALARELAARADRHGLYQLSTLMNGLCDGDIDRLLPLSRAMLGAVPPGPMAVWRQFIDRHLRDLNALNASVRDDQRPRLVAWTRFVRKYVLLGHTFAGKRSQLRELVEQNYHANKYLDALIYQARLVQQRYDVRWDAEVGDEVDKLHAVVCVELGTVIVAVTVDAKLAVFKRSGERLLLAESPDSARPHGRSEAPARTLAPFAAQNGARSLASTVVPYDTGFRAVLSCTQVPDVGTDGRPAGMSTRQPCVRVIDIRLEDGVLIAQISNLDLRDRGNEIYVIQPLPGRADVFAVGLATDSAPVGRLRESDNAWLLQPFSEITARSPDTAPTHALDKVPTRALAVAVDRRGYLMVAGSDDGVVRVVAIDAVDAAWTIQRWDRVNDAITSVALGAHIASESSSDASFSCYLGTASGDTFALSIRQRAPSTAVPAVRFGPYDAEPLWRESLDGPILATRLWSTPLFRDHLRTAAGAPGEILVIVTEKGRLGIYHHASGGSPRSRISSQSNYYFRGMRLDRISLSEPLRAVVVLDGEAEVVTAGPRGMLSMVRLGYLLNSVELDRGDARDTLEAPGGVLPDTVPTRQDHLFLRSVHDVPFRPAPAPLRSGSGDDGDGSVALKHELCNLIRMEGGALSHYILDRTWSGREYWDRLTEEELRKRLQARLGRLDPEDPEDAALIKIVIKAACRAHLRRDPDKYRDQLLANPASTLEQSSQIVALCEIVADYITRRLVYATRAAARLRIVAIKELLRVPVLRHIARDRNDTRVRDAIASAIDACLRDDDRLVRIETLRALWVMLRNIAVMADQTSDRRHALIAALFPDGIGSLDWLIERLIGGLMRVPSFTRRSALIGAAWFHVSVLLPVFRLFADHTLALCHRLITAGLDIELVAMCMRSLRGRSTAEIRGRIHHLYLLSAIEKPYSRDDYVRSYRLTAQAAPPADANESTSAAERPWYEFDDNALSSELAGLLDHLARMWEASEVWQTLPLVRLATHSPYQPIAEELAKVASALPQLAGPAAPMAYGTDVLERLAELDARYRSGTGISPVVTAPIRAVLCEIVEAWQRSCSPTPAEPEQRLRDGYVLGERVVDGSHVFQMREPAQWRDGYVIRMFHRWHQPGAARRFIDAARFTRNLRDDPGHLGAGNILEITEILTEQPYLGYVMRDHGKTLEAWLGSARPEHQRMAWADHAAQQLGHALALIHARRGYHGNVKLSEVFVGVDDPDRDPMFVLGGLAHDQPGDDRSLLISGIPESLRQKCRGANDLRQRQWGDLAALAWVLYQILDGAPLRPIPADPRELEGILAPWRTKAEGRVGLRHVIDALTRVFDPRTPSFAINEFLGIVEQDATPPEPQVREASRDCARRDRVGILHLSDLHLAPDTDVETVLTPLCADLEDRVGGLGEHRVDLIVISGDLSNRGSTEEFKVCQRFIAALLKRRGLTSARCIVVPGNHDLSWDASAYDWVAARHLRTIDPALHVPQGIGFLVRNEHGYLERFRNFSEHLFDPLFQRPYAFAFEDQYQAVLFEDLELQILAFNSAWEVDEHFPERSGIHRGAVVRAVSEANRAVAEARGRGVSPDILRLAVWHHPISGNEKIADDAFVGLLCGAGVRVCLHGHVHEDRADLIRYLHPVNRLHAVGAGSFGAPMRDRPEATPRLYNLLELAADRSKARVYTRQQRRQGGAWEPWCVWPGRTEGERQAFYDITL